MRLPWMMPACQSSPLLLPSLQGLAHPLPRTCLELKLLARQESTMMLLACAWAYPPSPPLQVLDASTLSRAAA